SGWRGKMAESGRSKVEKNLRVESGSVRNLPAAGVGEDRNMPPVALWGDFEVQFDQILGRGGMGSVYLAFQKSLGRKVAVKVVETSKAPDDAFKEAFLQKFRIEIVALSRLNDPRIVTIFQ